MQNAPSPFARAQPQGARRKPHRSRGRPSPVLRWSGDVLVVVTVFAAAIFAGKMYENGFLDRAYAAIGRELALSGETWPGETWTRDMWSGETWSDEPEPVLIGARPYDAPPPIRQAGLPARWGALPLCGQGKRVTCLVDGDTGWAGGTKWRLLDIDAPEISRPDCPREKAVARQATRRLQSLLSSGYTLDGDGQDRYGRKLVTITLSDGRDAGDVLISEGLAQPWPNHGNPWCAG